MGVGKGIMTGLAAAAATAAIAAQPTRPPDAHDRGGPRTDVVEDSDGIIAPDHYVPPRANWRYRAVAAGERLPPEFTARRYIVADPNRFGLPPARGSQCWVRYGEDLLLVDLRSGRVLRAIRTGYRRAR